MSEKPNSDRVARARAAFEQAKAKLQKVESAESAKQRRADAHRKILIGGLVMAKARKDPAFATTVAQILRETALNERDTAVLQTVLSELDAVKPPDDALPQPLASA
jgi:hypothetical protein